LIDRVVCLFFIIVYPDAYFYFILTLSLRSDVNPGCWIRPIEEDCDDEGSVRHWHAETCFCNTHR